MKEPEKIINWVGLSRYLAGNDSSISANRCPKKYQEKVSNLISGIEEWADKEN